MRFWEGHYGSAGWTGTKPEDLTLPEGLMGKFPSGAFAVGVLVFDEIQECEVTGNFLSGRLNAHQFLVGQTLCLRFGT